MPPKAPPKVVLTQEESQLFEEYLSSEKTVVMSKTTIKHVQACIKEWESKYTKDGTKAAICVLKAVKTGFFPTKESQKSSGWVRWFDGLESALQEGRIQRGRPSDDVDKAIEQLRSRLTRAFFDFPLVRKAQQTHNDKGLKAAQAALITEGNEVAHNMALLKNSNYLSKPGAVKKVCFRPSHSWAQKIKAAPESSVGVDESSSENDKTAEDKTTVVEAAKDQAAVGEAAEGGPSMDKGKGIKRELPEDTDESDTYPESGKRLLQTTADYLRFQKTEGTDMPLFHPTVYFLENYPYYNVSEPNSRTFYGYGDYLIVNVDGKEQHVRLNNEDLAALLEMQKEEQDLQKQVDEMLK